MAFSTSMRPLRTGWIKRGCGRAEELFPAAPALCLLCARAWSDVRHHHDDPRHKAAQVGLYFIAPILIAAATNA